ncbi:MAG: hypothetical protein ACKO9Q_05340, partial [Pirellula sp.]
CQRIISALELGLSDEDAAIGVRGRSKLKFQSKVAHCTCNGEVIEEALKLPATGPIGLEGDHGQMEYRRIRISTKP